MSESLPEQTPDDLPDFGLTTDEGNSRVDLLVREVVAVVHAGSAERHEVLEALSDGVREIGADHPEVSDITVRTAILREIDPVFRAAGWTVPEPFEF